MTLGREGGAAIQTYVKNIMRGPQAAHERQTDANILGAHVIGNANGKIYDRSSDFCPGTVETFQGESDF